MISEQSANTYHWIISNEITELNSLVKALDSMANEWNISKKLKNQLNLVIEEIVTNIIKYGYPPNEKHTISIALYNNNSNIEIKVIDDGIQFNLLETQTTPNINADIDERQIGGLGIHIVKTVMDAIEYNRVKNKNVLVLKKNI